MKKLSFICGFLLLFCIPAMGQSASGDDAPQLSSTHAKAKTEAPQSTAQPKLQSMGAAAPAASSSKASQNGQALAPKLEERNAKTEEAPKKED